MFPLEAIRPLLSDVFGAVIHEPFCNIGKALRVVEQVAWQNEHARVVNSHLLKVDVPIIPASEVVSEKGAIEFEVIPDMNDMPYVEDTFVVHASLLEESLHFAVGDSSEGNISVFVSV